MKRHKIAILLLALSFVVLLLSLMWRPLLDRVLNGDDEARFEARLNEIRRFERTLANDGTLFVEQATIRDNRGWSGSGGDTEETQKGEDKWCEHGECVQVLFSEWVAQVQTSGREVVNDTVAMGANLVQYVIYVRFC